MSLPEKDKKSTKSTTPYKMVKSDDPRETLRTCSCRLWTLQTLQTLSNTEDTSPLFTKKSLQINSSLNDKKIFVDFLSEIVYKVYKVYKSTKSTTLYNILNLPELKQLEYNEPKMLKYIVEIEKFSKQLEKESQKNKVIGFLLMNGWKCAEEISQKLSFPKPKNSINIINRYEEFFEKRKVDKITEYKLSEKAINEIVLRVFDVLKRKNMDSVKDEYVEKIKKFVVENTEEINDSFYENPDNNTVTISYKDIYSFFKSDVEIDTRFYDNLKSLCFDVTAGESLSYKFDREEFTLKIIDLPSFMSIDELKSSYVNKMLRFPEFEIIMYENLGVITTSTVYECPACVNRFEIDHSRDKVRKPSRCSNCGRKGEFIVFKNNLTDFITMFVKSTNEIINKIEIPVNFYGKKARDLWKNLASGQRIIFEGFVNTIKEKNNPTRSYFIDGINFDIQELRIDITKEDIEEIKKLSKQKEIHEKLALSIAPHIKGKTLGRFKRGLVFYLLGGSTYKLEDGTKKFGNIHVINFGHLGIGKSQVAEWISINFRNANYIEITKTTTGGIIGIAEKPKDKWIIKDGILARSHNGYAMIDEADKAELEKLNGCLEVMSLGRSTLEKAGMRKVSPAETSVLFLANPKTLDEHKRIVQVGRFTLKNLDNKMSEIDRSELILGGIRNELIENRCDLIYCSIISAKESIKIIKDVSSKDIIKPELLEKYIAYAKLLCPKHTKESKKLIEDYHIKSIYKFYESVSDTEKQKAQQVSMRDYGRIEKLSEAAAKIRLSKKVEKQDIELAIKIFEEAQDTFKLRTYDFKMPTSIEILAKEKIQKDYEERQKIEDKK